MMTPQKKRDKEVHRLRAECGWTFRKIADHFSLSVERARQIYEAEERFLQWPKLKQMLSVRAQRGLLARFGNDETIFNDPERIIAQTDAWELLRCKNIGKTTAAEIVAALAAQGYRLRTEWRS